MTQSAPADAAPSVMPSAAREKRLAKAMLNRRWKEFARAEKRRAFLDTKKKRLESKNKAVECRRKIEILFLDGRAYYDSRFYKEAIATWYEILLVSPECKNRRAEKKAEALIIKAQKALVNYTKAKIRREKNHANTEARLARSALEKAKKRTVGGKNK